MLRSALAIAGVLAFGCSSLAACSSESSTTTASLQTSATPTPTETNVAACPGDPHAHVYSPDRLQLLAACIKVTGTIEEEQAEPDGDYHVRLRLDPGQTCVGQPCLDADNVSGQAGDLLLEPVCENPVTQADAVAACQGYHNPLVLPRVGSHVEVTGPFVLDTDHGWNEIHPLESVTVVPAPTPVGSPSPSMTTAPATLSVTITASTYGSIAATTAPGASCTAQAKLPSGRLSTAAGLQVTVVAGSDGAVSWTYRTVSTTTKGTGTHTVTCTLEGATASASAAFTVS
jgi:hypothetical protein